MEYKYCTANNWGKNFFTHDERSKFYLCGYPGNVWVTDNNISGNQWILKVSGVVKTKTEAQNIVDTEVTASQNAWDAQSDDYKSVNLRPANITLP